MATDVVIRIDDARSNDPDRLDHTVMLFRREVLDIPGIRSVRQQAVPPPRGAKSGSAVAIGTLVITLTLSDRLLKELGFFFQAWLHRNDRKNVTLVFDKTEVTLNGLSEDAIRELLCNTLKAAADD